MSESAECTSPSKSMRAGREDLFVEFGEDLVDHGGEDHQHADPHREHTGVLVAKVETDGQHDHPGKNRDQHGVKRRHRDHGDSLVGGVTASLGGFRAGVGDVWQEWIARSLWRGSLLPRHKSCLLITRVMAIRGRRKTRSAL
ncbi:hypothetical protein EMIT0180MI3_360037 [Priestia megaterium]